MPTWAELVFLACAIGFILALKGLSGPRTARVGNLVGAGAAVVACIVPFFYADLDNVALILVAVAIGTAIGAVGAQRVQMTQMPQMVALFNGVVGAATMAIAVALTLYSLWLYARRYGGVLRNPASGAA